MATKAELEAEVALLRAELAALRAQVAAAQALPVPYIPPSCTCGTTIICQAHPRPQPGVWISGQWQSMANAGCAPSSAFMIPDAAGGVMYTSILPATAGCAGAPVHAMQYFTAGT